MTTSEDIQPILSGEHVLIHRAQQGDRQAFAVLVETYYDRLYRWLYHLCHDRHAAEDLAQETFLKAFAGLRGFRTGSHFRAWLYRIAYNNFANLRRAAGSARVLQPFPDHLPANAADPAEQAISREMLQQVARAVGRLPHEFRAAFLLRVEEGLSFREIADVLHTTEETARRVFKARHKLVKTLEPQKDTEKS